MGWIEGKRKKENREFKYNGKVERKEDFDI